MKGKKLILPLAALSLMLSMGLAACGPKNSDSGNESKPAQSSQQAQEKITVTAEGNKKNLILGEKVQLTASVEGVTWESDKPEIATVSASGLVESKGAGTAKITAKKDGYKEGSISIKVDLETIKVTAADNKTSLLANETVQLSADQDGVTWSSSDNAIAEVSAAGLVTAKKFGSAVISAEKSGFNKGSITINVVRPEPTAVLSLDQADHYSPTGEWAGYNTNYDTPVYAKEQASGGYCLAHFANGCKETFTFSSDKAVKAEVTLVILARSSYSDLSACFTAKFNNADISLAGIAYEGSADYPSMEVELGSFDLIKGNNVLEINFLGNSPYLDDVKVYAAEAATLAVVPAPEKDPVVVNETSLSIKEGKTAAITSSMTGLSYKSASTAIATVDEAGVVTGVKVGETTISVSKDGYKTIKVPVTVTEAEGVIAVSINEGTSENDAVTFRTSQNLTAPYNYIVDAWPEGAVLTIKANATAAGAFNMYMRARASGGYQSSTTDDLATCMEVKVNNTAVAATGTVSGSTFTDYLLGEVNLNAGENVITIKCLTTVPTMNLLRFIPKA